MTKLREVYVCEICGNIVEVLDEADGELICCGQPMTLQKENTKEAAMEKHLPVVQREGDRLKVKVGSVAHPMESAHFIEWIELLEDGRVTRAELKPGDKPEADFPAPTGDFVVRAYCNLHGLWKK